jgi:hypothetical protein
MRSHHIVAFVTALAVGFGVKLFFFSGPSAEANVDPVKSASMEISKMQANAKLPTETIYDMTFVFPHGE